MSAGLRLLACPAELRGFSPASERRWPQPASAFLPLEELMTHYARTGCPRLALCVSRHMQCLALHPDALPVVRDICAGLHGAWSEASVAAEGDARAIH